MLAMSRGKTVEPLRPLTLDNKANIKYTSARFDVRWLHTINIYIPTLGKCIIGLIAACLLHIHLYVHTPDRYLFTRSALPSSGGVVGGIYIHQKDICLHKSVVVCLVHM